MTWKTIIYNLINTLLAVPFMMVLCTAFIVSKDLANGVVSGKYFWFYLSMALSSVSLFISFSLNRNKVSFSFIDGLFTLFCVSGFIITYHINGSISNKSFLLLLTLSLFFYFRIFLVQYKWNGLVLVCAFIFTGLVEAIWGLRQLYGFTPSLHNVFKITGSFFNPGPYAGYLAMIMPMALYYTLNDYHIFKQKLHFKYILFYSRWGISVLSLFIIFMILPATMSRASWLAAATGCIVIGVLFLIKNKKIQLCINSIRKNSILIVMGTVAVLVAVLTGTYHLKKDSADGRALIWKISMEIIEENPFGVGLGNFSGVYGDKQAAYFADQRGSEQEQMVAGNPEYAFNEYIQICVELGIVPLLIFIALITFTIKNAIQSKNFAPLGALLSMLIFASMSYPFNILPFLISFAFIIALCVENNPANGQEKSSEFIFTLIFITGFISFTSIYNRYHTYDAYKKWSKYQILYNAGLYDDLNEKFSQLYPHLNHEIKFLFEYAQSLSKSEQYEESNKVLKQATQISCDPMLYNIMGKNHQALGNFSFAEDCFNKSALIVPSRLYPYYLKAKLYDELGDMDGVCRMADFILKKEAKVHSIAIEEMREEMISMCEKYKTK